MAGTPRGPRRVLVADDDAEMRELVAAALAAAGFDVTQAADGQELLRLLVDAAKGAAAPAIVVSDVAMPYLTGPQVLAAAHEAGVAVPFIFMTAFASSGGAEAAADTGAVAVLDKPFELEDLVAAVQSELD